MRLWDRRLGKPREGHRGAAIPGGAFSDIPCLWREGFHVDQGPADTGLREDGPRQDELTLAGTERLQPDARVVRDIKVSVKGAPNRQTVEINCRDISGRAVADGTVHRAFIAGAIIGALIADGDDRSVWKFRADALAEPPTFGDLPPRKGLRAFAALGVTFGTNA